MAHQHAVFLQFAVVFPALYLICPYENKIGIGIEIFKPKLAQTFLGIFTRIGYLFAAIDIIIVIVDRRRARDEREAVYIVRIRLIFYSVKVGDKLLRPERESETRARHRARF